MRRYFVIGAAAALCMIQTPLQASESFVCRGHIISDGDHQTKVQKHCGKPSRREGSRWIYDRGSSHMVVIVHFDEGVVSLIEHVPRD